MNDYQVIYHPDVAAADFRKIPADMRIRILRAIGTRLSTAPEHYGTPLRETLKGYWKLRVGDYRAVYRVEGKEVRIFAVRHRGQVYEWIIQRAASWRSR